MTDLIGPASASNSTTTRPAMDRVFGLVDTWFKDCSSPVSEDGTAYQADFFNGLLGLFRSVIRGNGKKADGVTPVVPENNADDTMLLGAIQQLIQRGQTNFVIDSGTDDALVVAPSPPLAEYKPGLRLLILKNPAAGANHTTAPTIDAGLGPVPIVKCDAAALGPGDLRKAGLFELELNGTGPARLIDLVTPSDLDHVAQQVTQNVTQQSSQQAAAQIVAAASVIRVTDAASASTPDALTGTASPAITAYGPSQIFIFTQPGAGANTSTAPTGSVTGANGAALGTLPFTKWDGSPLPPGDIPAGAQFYAALDAAGTHFRVLTRTRSDAVAAAAQASTAKTLVSQSVAGTYTFTVPDGVYWLLVTMVGGGGGGSGGASSGGTTSGGGGGAGGAAQGWIKVPPGQVITYVVGAGGAGAGYQAQAANGGTSAIANVMQASGGGGGNGNPPSGGSGGVGVGGQSNFVGGSGNDGSSTSGTAPGGAGGSSLLGGGGRTSSFFNPPLSNGRAPGSGGGGTYSVGGGGQGGNGADGYVSFQY